MWVLGFQRFLLVLINYWNLVWLHFRAMGGHKDLVEFFIQQGAKNWESGFIKKVKNLKKDLFGKIFNVRLILKIWSY